MHFTDRKKDELYQWVRNNLHIKGMYKLYEQITRDGKVNYNRDKDGFFFQTQITRQLVESRMYDITMVEDKGIGYDIDIELNGHIYLQAWFGSNVVGYLLDRAVADSNLPLTLYSERTCTDEDLDVRQRKLDQINKPINIRRAGDPVKILVAMSSTRLPLHFPPEWDHLLKDRVIIELRGDFDGAGNRRGAATLHRSSTQWDKVVKGIVDALGFRYVESFTGLGAGRSSMRFGGLPGSAWQSSYLNTASQHIWLQPKVMASVLNSNLMAEYIMDTTGHEPSPELVDNHLSDELRREGGRVMWADVEQPGQSVVPILGAYRFESLDRIIADRNLVKNSPPGLYNLYGGKIDRDKTDAFDAVVVDAENGDLEIDQIECLLRGIRFQSNKTPDCFCGDPIAIEEMLELGSAGGYLGVTEATLGKCVMQLNSIMGIPVLHSYDSGPSKPGCIYAISYKDELGVPSVLRLLESSFHEVEACGSMSSNSRIAYVIGETAVDPRACGKIMNIRRPWQ